MARKRFAVARFDVERTDPVVVGDHIEEIGDRFVLKDEEGREVYSVKKSEGRFIDVQ